MNELCGKEHCKQTGLKAISKTLECRQMLCLYLWLRGLRRKFAAAGIAGLKGPGYMDVCLLRVLYVVR